MSTQNPWEMDENWEYNPDNTASYGYNNPMTGFNPQTQQSNYQQPAYQQQQPLGNGPTSPGGSGTSYAPVQPQAQSPSDRVTDFRTKYANLLGIQGYTPPAFNSTYNPSAGPTTQGQWRDHVMEMIANHFLNGSPELQNNMGRIGSQNGSYLRMLGLQPQQGQNARLSDLFNQNKVTTKFW